MKTLFINGRFLSQPLTGVQRYCHELLCAWDALNPDVELICLAPPEDFPRPSWNHIQLNIVGKNRGNLWEQVDLPLSLRGRFLFSPANIGPVFYSNQAVTMHDASVFAVPEAYSRMFKAKYRFVFGRLVSHARRLLTDSVFSQKELAKYLKYPEARFHVILLGGDHLNPIKADEGILDEHSLHDQPFMLMVASQSPHKNMKRLIEAVGRLQGGEMRFVLVGGKNNLIFQDQRVDTIPSNVIPTGYVNDGSLKALYQHALGFVFPSFYEGFGLPVLEAMNCGCPVLCSRAASLPEVGGDAALYFDPLNVSDMTARIEEFLGNPTLQSDLRTSGHAQARRFRWEQTARRTLDLLKECL